MHPVLYNEKQSISLWLPRQSESMTGDIEGLSEKQALCLKSEITLQTEICPQVLGNGVFITYITEEKTANWRKIKKLSKKGR